MARDRSRRPIAGDDPTMAAHARRRAGIRPGLPELAARRDGDERDILLQLADAEQRHAAYWAGLLGDRAGPPRRGNLRMRLLALLARRFGWVFVLALVQQAEMRSLYAPEVDTPPSIEADERIHSEGCAVWARAVGHSTAVRCDLFAHDRDRVQDRIASIVDRDGCQRPVGHP